MDFIQRIIEALSKKEESESGKKYSFVKIKAIITSIAFIIALFIALASYSPIRETIGKGFALIVCIMIIILITVVVSQMVINIVITYIKKKNF